MLLKMDVRLKRFVLLHEQSQEKGTSKPGKGSVTDKALARSAKTAKKPTKKRNEK